jgi:hypothetical protein
LDVGVGHVLVEGMHRDDGVSRRPEAELDDRRRRTLFGRIGDTYREAADTGHVGLPPDEHTVRGVRQEGAAGLQSVVRLDGRRDGRRRAARLRLTRVVREASRRWTLSVRGRGRCTRRNEATTRTSKGYDPCVRATQKVPVAHDQGGEAALPRAGGRPLGEGRRRLQKVVDRESAGVRQGDCAQIGRVCERNPIPAGLHRHAGERRSRRLERHRARHSKQMRLGRGPHRQRSYPRGPAPLGERGAGLDQVVHRRRRRHGAGHRREVERSGHDVERHPIPTGTQRHRDRAVGGRG